MPINFMFTLNKTLPFRRTVVCSVGARCPHMLVSQKMYRHASECSYRGKGHPDGIPLSTETPYHDVKRF